MPEPTSTRAPANHALRLVRLFAVRELRVRYRQTVFEVAWAFATPIAVVMVYGFVLTRSFGVSSQCGGYLPSAWTGIVLWALFSTAVGNATASLVASAALVRKVPLPIQVLPLASVLAAVPDLAIGSGLLGAVLLIEGQAPSAYAPVALLPIASLVVWSAAFGVLFGVLAAFYRDLVHAVQVALRVGFFATPVVYESDFVPPQLRWTGRLNPVAVSIDGVRDAVLCGSLPNLALTGLHLGLGVVALAGSLAYAKSVRTRVPDVV